MVEQVPMWKSSNGKLHETEEAAKLADRKIEVAENIDKWIYSSSRWPKSANRAKRAIIEYVLWSETEEEEG